MLEVYRAYSQERFFVGRHDSVAITLPTLPGNRQHHKGVFMLHYANHLLFSPSVKLYIVLNVHRAYGSTCHTKPQVKAILSPSLHSGPVQPSMHTLEPLGSQI